MSDLNILYVEDHPLNAGILKRLVRKLWGIELEIAETAEMGFELMTQKSFQMIYMDLHLPGIGGVEAIKIIRETHSKEQLPVIAITADASTEAYQAVIKSGGNNLITKPVDVARFKELSEKALPDLSAERLVSSS